MNQLQEDLTPPFARYELRVEDGLEAQFGENSARLFGAVALLATEVDGKAIALQPAVHFFGPGVESSRGFTERLDLQVAGDPLLLPRNAPNLIQDVNVKLTGQLLADGFMRDPENPKRFRLQRESESCCYGPTEDAIIRLEGHLTGLLAFNQPVDARLSGDAAAAPEMGWLQSMIELQVTSKDPPWVTISFNFEGPIGLGQVLLPETPAEMGLPPAPVVLAIPAPPLPASPAAANSAEQALCSPRTLWTRLVFFTDNGTNTGGGSQTQLASAAGIWGKACITLAEANLPHTESNTGLAQSGAVETICAAYDPPTGVIPVFFVANDLAADGGGATMAPGTALARVVISDHSVRNIGGGKTINLSLLAHELGHVLGAVHPSETPPEGRWKGEPASIMAAAWNTRNPLQNCVEAYNAVAVPASTPPMSTCPMKPDP